MTEDLKGLIDRINEEGVKAAEEKASRIETGARTEAEAIVSRARVEAANLLSDAKDRIAKLEEASRSSLKQAARDLILSLRKEINATLDRVVTSHVHKAFSQEELSKLIIHLIRECRKEEKDDIVICLRKEDLEKLEKGLMAELRGEAKKGIVLKLSEDIRGGFVISYDSGRSYCDYSDAAIAEYISTYLRPKLAEILKGSV